MGRWRSYLDFLLSKKRSKRSSVSASLSNRSASDDGYYPSFCRDAALQDDVFATFKRHPIYTQILEHVNSALGKKYVDVIHRDGLIALDKYLPLCQLNDTIGHPHTCLFKDIGRISPSNLRYLKVCSDLKQHFGDISGCCVAEIGVGYGGQAFFMDALFGPLHFTLFDLKYVLMLVERYLESFTLKGSYCVSTLNQFSSTAAFDLVVSNYAFSELPKPLQLVYMERVVAKARRGYLTMNAVLHRETMTFEDLEAHIPGVQRYSEEPRSGKNIYIAVWDNSK